MNTTPALLKQHLHSERCYSEMMGLLGLPAEISDDTKIPLLHVLEACGIKDAIWALRATIEDSYSVAAEIALRAAERAVNRAGAGPQARWARAHIVWTRRYKAGETSLIAIRISRWVGKYSMPGYKPQDLAIRLAIGVGAAITYPGEMCVAREAEFATSWARLDCPSESVAQKADFLELISRRGAGMHKPPIQVLAALAACRGL